MRVSHWWTVGGAGDAPKSGPVKTGPTGLVATALATCTCDVTYQQMVYLPVVPAYSYLLSISYHLLHLHSTH